MVLIIPNSVSTHPPVYGGGDPAFVRVGASGRSRRLAGVFANLKSPTVSYEVSFKFSIACSRRGGSALAPAFLILPLPVHVAAS